MYKLSFAVALQVQSETLQEQYMRILPAEERKYVLEGANPRVRKERLLARTLVRVTLARSGTCRH